MQLMLYVSDDRSREGRVSFYAHKGKGERLIAIVVPDGSALTGHNDFCCLQVPDGKAYPAAKVLVFCKVGVEGFGFPQAEQDG